ncbi:MAG TPA: biotin/lipoyl-containing protein [Thermoplasmata archaeon]|nr:biotin/lipoyl-containing protein [Thermoplasmata archaeon]
MRIEIRVEDRNSVAEVDLAAGTVTLEGRSHPFTIVGTQGERVELDIDGDRIVVEGWPQNNELPSARLSVNGEIVRVGEVVRGPLAREAVPRSGPSPPPPDRPRTSPAPVAASDGPGIVVRPPMPGKVLEVRVAEGSAVKPGDILVVLEAMKMRNEVASPASGVVRGLQVAPGTSVKARDVMLRIAPG